jgi:uncharacterized membrane protein
VQTQPGEVSGRRRLIFAAVLLGVGLGGLFDGIVLHQILQWHHMVSSATPPTTLQDLELNTVADGLFHAGSWLLTVAGVFVLAAANGTTPRRGRGRTLLGGALVGWGLFNTVEGLIDHHLLGLHHVRPGPDALVYDVAFLLWGLAMLLTGAWLLRSAPRASSRSGMSSA